MSSQSRTSSFPFSLEALRREHPSQYRSWVMVGVLMSLLGYTASSVSFATRNSWGAALSSGDPFVALANVIALGALVRRHSRAAASVALTAAFVDVHYSLFTLTMPTLGNVGLVIPAFVLTAGLFFGGPVGFLLAVLLAVSVPATLWIASLWRTGRGLEDGAILHFLVVLEVVLAATTALLWAFLRTFAEILRQHQESEARSRELLAQLQHAQKLEALGLLAGGVAHDFNNLLAAIGGYGALLDRSNDQNARELGAQIVAAQQHGATLTKQLLAFARKDISQPKPMDLARTLSRLTGLLQRAVGERTRLHVEGEPDCVIVADPGRIEQVVFNLAVNARDAMPNGGRLWIRCRKTEDRVYLEVEDEGLGMDEQTLSRAFEPFFTTKGLHEGTGLGLSTVHGILVDSGGDIELSSRVGHGTRFIVRWPRVALVPVPDEDTPVELDGAGRTVLWVEDNDGARAYVERLLLDRGFHVVSTSSAGEAWTFAAGTASAPDLVLSDVMLPDSTGPELVARLKARWPALPCLFVSGYAGDVALGEGFALASDLVPKPFTSTELLAHIARKLGAASATDRRPLAQGHG